MVDVAKDVNLPLELQKRLGNWLSHQIDFYSCEDCPSCALACFRTRQQDVCQYAHRGPVSATDGSVDLKGDEWEPASLLLKNQGQILFLSLQPQ